MLEHDTGTVGQTHRCEGVCVCVWGGGVIVWQFGCVCVWGGGVIVWLFGCVCVGGGGGGDSVAVRVCVCVGGGGVIVWQFGWVCVCVGGVIVWQVECVCYVCVCVGGGGVVWQFGCVDTDNASNRRLSQWKGGVQVLEFWGLLRFVQVCLAAM